MMEMAVTTGAINRAKLQSNHHHQQTNMKYFNLMLLTGITIFGQKVQKSQDWAC